MILPKAFASDFHSFPLRLHPRASRDLRVPYNNYRIVGISQPEYKDIALSVLVGAVGSTRLNEVSLCGVTTMYLRNSPMDPLFGEPAYPDATKHSEKRKSCESVRKMNFSPSTSKLTLSCQPR